MMNWTTVSVSDMLLLDELSKEPCISYLVSRASKVAYLTKYLKGIEDIGFIAGGSIRAAFEGTTPRDIDIFFSSAENHMKAIALFEADKTKKKLYTGKNATAFSHEDGREIQLIGNVELGYNDPRGTIAKFDFIVAKVALAKIDVTQEDQSVKKQWTLVHHPEFFRDLTEKTLSLSHTNSPLSTFDRVIKYAEYGYKMSSEDKARLLNAARNTKKMFDTDELNRYSWD